MSKIGHNLGQLLTLTTNFSRTNQDIENWKQNWSTVIFGGWVKKLVNFNPLTKNLQVWMLTHLKLIMQVLRVLMHWRSGHMTLLWVNF